MKKQTSVKTIAWFSALKQSDKGAVDYLVGKIRPLVINSLCRQGADKPEAEDVFMTVILYLFRKILTRQVPFFDNDKFEAYFMGACQKQWLNKYSQKKRHLMVTNEELDILSNGQDIEEEILKAERTQFIWRVFQQLSSDCQNILHLFIIEEKSHEEIAEQTGSTYDYAKTKKYRCYKKFLKMIQSNPLFDELTD
jgi:RNA polymerase sigma factor (sigma-70 family)